MSTKMMKTLILKNMKETTIKISIKNNELRMMKYF